MQKISTLFLFLILLIPSLGRADDDALNISQFGELATALSVIGQAETTLAIPYSVPVPVSLTIPANIRLRFVNSGRLDVAIAQTVTIRSSGVDWPLAQLFAGAGVVSFAGGKIGTLHPEWWGAKGDGLTDDQPALQRCANAALTISNYNGGRIKLIANAYRIESTWRINNPNDDPSHAVTSRISIEGDGRYLTRIEYAGTGAAIRFWFNKHYDLSNLYIRNIAENQTGVGIRITGPAGLSGNVGGGNTTWKAIAIDYFDKGVDLGDTQTQVSGSEYTITHLAINRCNIGMLLKGSNTEDFTIKQYLSSFNSISLVTLNANNIHIDGGSSSNDGQLFDLGTVGVFSLENYRAEGFGQRVLRGSGNIKITSCTLTPGFGHHAGANDFAFRIEGPTWVSISDSSISGRVGLATLEHGHESSIELKNNRWFNEEAIDAPFHFMPGSGAMAVSVQISGNSLYKDSNHNLYVKTFDDGWGVNNAGFKPFFTPSINIVRGPGYPAITAPSLYLNTLKGISSTETAARNFAGSITITGSALVGAIVFPNPEVDSNYRILLTQEPGDGANVGDAWIQAGSKSAAGFAVQLESAPGVGKINTIHWLLVR